MVMQNKAMICAQNVLINGQYASNMRDNKQLVKNARHTSVHQFAPATNSCSH